MLNKFLDLIDAMPTTPKPRQTNQITEEDIKLTLKVIDHLTLKTGSAILHSIKDKVKPAVGSVVFCRLGLNQVEHTGIYIGYNKIIHLEGNGQVKTVTPKEFLARLIGFNTLTAQSIYIACRNGKPIHSSKVATNAKIYGAHRTDYRLLSNNCHKFTSGCVTGDRHNNDTFFNELESTLKRDYGMTEWRIWGN